ncbi:hypothetical protein TNCV_3801371 [Trichonephila clavipes]|nr:hypothetical protein TNCV_3801371 [Trichonephila clavipes]
MFYRGPVWESLVRVPTFLNAIRYVELLVNHLHPFMLLFFIRTVMKFSNKTTVPLVTFSFRNEFHSFRTILDRVLGARAAGVHYRLFSVWTLVPVRLGKQLSDNSTVDEIASEAADCRLTYTMANCPQRW